MTIPFSSVPSTLRVPFVAAEFDSRLAQQGPALLPYRGLLIGQKTASGTGTADTLYLVTSVNEVITLAGRGSMLHCMARAWFANNKSTELWIGILADNGAGTAATGSIAVTGPATADGTIPLYFGGVRIPVGVTAGQAATAIAANITAAITAAADLPITAATVSASSNLTYRHKGLVGNAYDVRQNFQAGEKLPAGVGLTITQLSGGASNPTLTNLIAAMAPLWFQIWAHPYTDATSLAALETELGVEFGPLKAMGSLAISSASGILSSLTTLGTGRNSPYSSIVSPPGISPLTPPMELAAGTAAQVAFNAAIDPARGFQTLAVSGAVAPPENDQFTLTEQDLLLHDGIATTRRVTGGGIQLGRIITTYQTNSAGEADTAYLDATTLLTLIYLRYSFRVMMQTRYPRHKLASDGTRVGRGQLVITPAIGRAEALTWFRDMERLGLVEGYDQFARDLVVERNESDPNRLDFLLPPDLINQLIVTGALFQFRL